MIDILIPVLHRPQNAQPLVDSIHKHTTVPHQIVFLTTAGDQHQYEACCQTGANVLIVQGIHNQYARKINQGFAVTSNPYVLLAADDLDFQPGWDTIALAVAEASGAGVIGTDDCANKHVRAGNFSTHPLVRRSYIEDVGGTWDDGPGVVLHEGYDHNMVDVELAHVAKARGQWAFALESRICHRHPGWKTAEMDATYAKGSSKFAADRRLFARRSRMWTKRTARR
jgi:hypothetical protein